MTQLHEHTEIVQKLRSDSGMDYLQSLPLIIAHVESAAVIGILREWANDRIPGIEAKLSCKLCLIAFGSLGRLEYVRAYSDLDPLILIQEDCDEDAKKQVRTSVLGSLTKDNPWLVIDDRELILQSEWSKLANQDLRFPVLCLSQFEKGSSPLEQQRRWQVLFESRPLYNTELCALAYRCVLPQVGLSASLLGTGYTRHAVDFRVIIENSPEFFAGFSNPTFLFKSALKYWKTRFLREFFEFSTQMSSVLGWFLQKAGSSLELDYLRSSTVMKIMRAHQFVEVLEHHFKNNEVNTVYYSQVIDEIIAKCNINKRALLAFQGRPWHPSSYAASTLHALLMCVLSRFSDCWERLYDPHVRELLERIPISDINFDALFRPAIQDPELYSLVEGLVQARKSYLRYMIATARIIDQLFIHGHVWYNHTVPIAIDRALKPFCRYNETLNL
jgi:hypothetical protein